MEAIKRKTHAILLVSGGVDSVTMAYYVKKMLGYRHLLFLFFDYGQKAKEQEEYFSRKQARKLHAQFIKITLPFLKKISISSLLHGPFRGSSRKSLHKKKEIQTWYVPARNTLFISYALAAAESFFLRGIKYDIFLGFKNEGRLHYPDTTKDYVSMFNALKKQAILGDPFIKAPLLPYDKEEVILLGQKLGVNYRETYSCYQGARGRMHCGLCMSCRLRQEGFYWANLQDPTPYASRARDYRDADYQP